MSGEISAGRRRRLGGVYCAIATPLLSTLEPDHDRLVQHARHLLSTGCDGLAPLGTTGEATSFSVAERRAILRELLAGGLRADQLVVGTGAAALPDAVELTRDAVEVGAQAVLVLPPFYYKNPPADGIFAYYAELIERVASPALRVVLYQIPQISGVDLNVDLIDRLCRAYPGAIVGLKDSSGNLERLLQTVARFPQLSVMAGPDTQLLPLLRAGGAGCISATSNLMSHELQFVYQHFDEPAREAEVQDAHDRLAVARAATMTIHSHIPSVKAALAHQHNHPGWRRVRPGLAPLTDPQARQVLDALNVLERPTAEAVS